jgi:hypothetical protein
MAVEPAQVSRRLNSQPVLKDSSFIPGPPPDSIVLLEALHRPHQPLELGVAGNVRERKREVDVQHVAEAAAGIAEL